MKKITVKSRRHNVASIIAFVLSFCFAGFLLIQGMTLSFVGYNAWNFNTYSLIAHNYTQYGFFATKLAPVISVAKILPDHPEYYLNHPPLQSILQSFTFLIVGESFLSARLPVILASLGSLFLMVAIARLLKSREFSLVVLIGAICVPATTIFGRMIGQEPIVLFFALLTSYFILLYERNRKSIYIISSCLVVIAGCLTDWPMVYFAGYIFFYLLCQKQKRFGVFLISTAIATSLLYIAYVSWIAGSAELLRGGFLNRSVGQLIQKNNWVLLWIGSIFMRLLLYFNPVIAFCAVWFSVKHFSFNIKKMIDARHILYLCFFLFGITHIILYPEGSFGHPYWIYYLLPWVVFTSSEVFFSLWKEKKYFLLVLILLFSLGYVCALSKWKLSEVQGNMFRYMLAKAAVGTIPSYENVLVNDNSLVDKDLLSYQFRINSIKLTEQKVNSKQFSYILYSCLNSCNKEDKQFAVLVKRFPYRTYNANGAEIVVFATKEPANKNIFHKKVIYFDGGVPTSSDSLFKSAYRFIMSALHLPQI